MKMGGHFDNLITKVKRFIPSLPRAINKLAGIYFAEMVHELTKGEQMIFRSSPIRVDWGQAGMMSHRKTENRENNP